MDTFHFIYHGNNEISFVRFLFSFFFLHTDNNKQQQEEEEMIGNIFGSLQMKKNESEFSSDIANVLASIPDVLEVPLDMHNDSEIVWPTATPQYATESDNYSSPSSEPEKLPARVPLAVYGEDGKMKYDINEILEMVDVEEYGRMLHNSMMDSCNNNLSILSSLRFELVCREAVCHCGYLLNFIDSYICAIPYFSGGVLVPSDLEKIMYLKNMATMVQKTGLAIIRDKKGQTRMCLVMPNHTKGIIYMGNGQYAMIESSVQKEKPEAMISLMRKLLIRKNQMVAELRFFPVPVDYRFSSQMRMKRNESLKKMNELEKRILWMINE